jgi:hypothetical protein
MIPAGEDNQCTKKRILELRVRDYEGGDKRGRVDVPVDCMAKIGYDISQ